MSVDWESLKFKPMTRFTSSKYNALIDAVKSSVDAISSDVSTRVKYDDLSRLAYSIIPDQDNTRDIGSSDKQWRNVYAVNGYFSGNLLVQGKQVIKDGDPVGIGDISDTARDKITQAVNNATLNQKLDTPLSQLARESTLQGIGSKIDVNLSTRASETTLQSVLTVLDNILPTLSRESTLQDVKKTLADISSAISEYGSLALLDYTTTPLAENGEWTSTVDDSPYTGRVVGSVYSDAPGTLYVEQSPDGSNWDIVDSFSVSGGSGVKFSVEKVCQYARVRYVNGSSAQSVFRLYAYRRVRAIQ